MRRASVLYIVVFLCVAQQCSSQAACGPGWIYHEEYCYLYIQDKYNWFDAQVACRTLRGTLVEIDSAQENVFVHTLITNITSATHTVTNTWIGLEDFAVENQFVWASMQRSPEYSHWQRGEPNNFGRGEDCAVIKTSGQWMDENCETQHYPALCERVMEADIIG